MLMACSVPVVSVLLSLVLFVSHKVIENIRKFSCQVLSSSCQLSSFISGESQLKSGLADHVSLPIFLWISSDPPRRFRNSRHAAN